ncbi:hypothetical protein IF188_17280 [Microbacterium sp. NEAU-LLC]|uniref:Uncharacterized protein n=1 Tax=Microbacterium helvum TaxID=2773713 RepID=A0ABR8NUM8_9MICO|nr:hypothetical protein [Microbacterium helvum]MBD3943447.1 hypothetical protein [Microbacterium helvum]
MGHVRSARRASMLGGTLTLLGIVALLAACAQSYPIPRAPDGDPIEAAKALSDAPDLVHSSSAEESCGAFVLGQDEAVPTDAVDCLSAAVSSGEDAALAWSFPTTEGDPIVSFAFAAGGAEVTVYTTNAFDSYGGDPEWTQSSCDPITATSRTGCPAS